MRPQTMYPPPVYNNNNYNVRPSAPPLPNNYGMGGGQGMTRTQSMGGGQGMRRKLYAQVYRMMTRNARAQAAVGRQAHAFLEGQHLRRQDFAYLILYMRQHGWLTQ